MIPLSGRDLWLLVLLTLFWGVNWPVMKIGVEDFPPMSFRTISMAGGIVVLAAGIRLRGLSFAVPREHRAELLRLGFFNMVLWYVLSIYGLKLLSSGRAAILGYTLSIWIAVWGIAAFGDRGTRRLWIGVAAAAVGIALLLSSEFGRITGRPMGTLFMLGAACVWGYGTHLMRRRRLPQPLPVITFWSLVQALVVCSAVSFALERDQWQHGPGMAGWAAIAYNAVVVFGFCQVMWFRLTTILPPVASGLSVMLIPVIGVFSGMWMLGERPAWQDYAALVAILVAIGSVLLPAKDADPTAGDA
jgi:drug/metabolite transporter (DMT)-like permease